MVPDTGSSGCQAGLVHHCAELALLQDGACAPAAPAGQRFGEQQTLRLFAEVSCCMDLHLVSCYRWLFSCNSHSSLSCTQDARRHCQLAVYLAERYVSEDTRRPCHALLCSPVRGTAACW